MQVSEINRKQKTLEIIKDNGETILLSFGEVDTLIEILFNLKYLIIENDIAFNHHLPEVRLAEVENGKYTEKTL